jgi:hypothetical protein
MLENAEAEGLVIRNNILSGNETCQISRPKKPAGAVIDHNLLESYHAVEDEVKGDSPVTGKALFRDPGKADFHLLPGSAASGAGFPDGAPKADFDGEIRGKPVTIGAFEP